jgi:uncharacterized phage-like protein YoqJ
VSELFINKARAVAITGHRVLYDDFKVDKLKKLLTKFVDKDFNVFLVGMALGFDTICFQVLEELRKEKDLKIIACVPCLKQDYKFTLKQKQEYERMLASADEKIILSKEYYSGCMQKRNRFMVDNCSVVLAYLKRDFGGTANTVNYARKLNIPVVEID